MSEVVSIYETNMLNIFRCEFEDGTVRLCTKNLSPGHNVYGERLIRYNKIEYREWNAFRSKLAGAIMKGLKESPLSVGSRVLYLGAASGTTVSHVSDIVEASGKVYAVEFSPRVVRELIMVAQRRPNVITILADARFPQRFRTLVEAVDVLYVDIAQPDQAEIASYNASLYLKKEGHLLLAIKARSIDVTKEPEEIYKREVEKLSSNGFDVRQVVNLDPYDKDHVMVLAKYEGK
ncbi:fibrillarin [Sulfodiicoccus acidiphilus]|uniref:Fibrillarin-like rRNA/tRNA 2'-O-methyltransferase n=1 Tax=Sulfodiicoccus acidiphilus TaxID=1670455 RepID=A0A348B361_9CREN|nr:fibrillarin-like rRNA/tRNA 2'-O-methyltransferase [Sulfodiicoccus acidiphilus]BBD72613.1 fibrillarin [Sulfodiicoccus acidiphilus]GGT93328.1 fibrillarin [Sulfodiicoccus acidiphilus]